MSKFCIKLLYLDLVNIWIIVIQSIFDLILIQSINRFNLHSIQFIILNLSLIRINFLKFKSQS